MILTIKSKLLPTAEQKASLLKTIEAFNNACNYVSEIAFAQNRRGHINLHHLCYYTIREKFNLSSQLAVRVIGKVSDSYKTDKKILHKFGKHSAIVYDKRLLSFKGLDLVSILTIDGRYKIPLVVGSYAKLEQRRVRGQANLIYQNGKFYLCLCVDVPEQPECKVDEYLGIDLGIVNIATTSDGDNFTGNHVNGLRKRHAKLRSKLQTKGTQSTKRLLRKRKNKEQRFANDVNHCISKNIVQRAKDTARGIALETLKGIRERITVRKTQMRQQHSWSFYDLQQKILYKAKLVGVPVVFINPRNTSRECPECGYISKLNRQTQSRFSCKSCGYAANADFVAARNISRRVFVNMPNVVCP